MVRSRYLKTTVKIEDTLTLITDHAVITVEIQCKMVPPSKKKIIQRMEPSLFIITILKSKNWGWVNDNTDENVNTDFNKFFALIHDSQEEARRSVTLRNLGNLGRQER